MLNLVLDETTECLRGEWRQCRPSIITPLLHETGYVLFGGHQNIFEGFHASPVHDPEGLEPLIVI